MRAERSNAFTGRGGRENGQGTCTGPARGGASSRRLDPDVTGQVPQRGSSKRGLGEIFQPTGDQETGAGLTGLLRAGPQPAVSAQPRPPGPGSSLTLTSCPCCSGSGPLRGARSARVVSPSLFRGGSLPFSRDVLGRLLLDFLIGAVKSSANRS